MRSILSFSLSTLSIALFSITSATNASAKAFETIEFKPSQMDFGGVGLMQMPTGRMADEGEFSVNGTVNNEYQWYSVSLQLMPWLESTIRYTIVDDLLYSNDPSFSGDTKYTDKGIDFKLRLIEEGRYLPEVSVGVRDFGGTGLFDGEFVAATKRFGNLDLTLGMGWGYIGQSGNVTNPFCKASDKYCTRPTDYKGSGGMVDFDRWFRGPAAIYGGFEYQTPYKQLRLKVEYDSNDYSQDYPARRADIEMTQHTPWNVGIVYQLGGWGDARLSYERGDTVVAGITLATNFNELAGFWKDEPLPEPRPSAVQTLDEVNWAEISQQLESNAGYQNNQILIKDYNEVVVYGEQVKYRDRDRAEEKAVAILANQLPEEIATYHVIETKESLSVAATEMNSAQFKSFHNQESIGASSEDAKQDREVESTKAVIYFDGRERLDYSLSPHLSQSFGSAESFYLYSIGIDAAASYWLTDSVKLSSSLYFNLVDNYDKFNYITPPDGTSVPRVRTQFRAYVHDNPVWMNHLQLTWFEEYGSGFYSQAYGGYLESMFAGVGGEVLYRSLNSNWAIGADLNLISQRDPESWFGVYEQPNQTGGDYGNDYVVMDQGSTGFVTAYYMPKWSFLDSTLFKVGIGKFLAGDIGTRIDFSKQFDSGVIAGAYASFTDLSSDEYGEGSFTKGFYLSIPFDLMTVRPSGNRANFNWQPITRDGGQVLNKQYHLFDLTDARSPWYQRPSKIN